MPSAHPFVKATLEGFQHSLAKPVMKKVLITVEILDTIVQDAKRSGTHFNFRLATKCLVGFAGFLQLNEFIHLRPCNFTVTEKMVKV